MHRIISETQLQSPVTGMGIRTGASTALVEDLAMARDQNKVPDGPKTMPFNAVAPMQKDIVEVP